MSEFILLMSAALGLRLAIFLLHATVTRRMSRTRRTFGSARLLASGRG